ncbi:hypothetical protein MMC13_002250 [Lambiella insularis]|nr:hypothetical protein [Lambiella insularis]
MPYVFCRARLCLSSFPGALLTAYFLIRDKKVEGAAPHQPSLTSTRPVSHPFRRYLKHFDRYQNFLVNQDEDDKEKPRDNGEDQGKDKVLAKLRVTRGRSPNAIVRIGLTLSVHPTILPASSPPPLTIRLTARVLSTPRPANPITLCTHRTPFDSLINRSYHDIICVSPSPASGSAPKTIPLMPHYWLNEIWDSENLGAFFEFVTIPSQISGGEFVRELEVPHEKVRAAGVESGERYVVRLTDKCLGTTWWCFGERADTGGRRLGRWIGGDEGLDRWSQWVERGEEPRELALVDETVDGVVVEFS